MAASGIPMRELAIRSMSTLAAVALASLALAPLSAAQTDRPAVAAATTIHVSGGEFFFKLTTKSIAKPGKATFVFKNVGHVEHDFKINGKVTPLIRPGKTATLAITFKKKGKYTYLCTVPGHAAAGMTGVFTVR
jgi:uncharacterized cupredoxin-like copper-binding protein